MNVMKGTGKYGAQILGRQQGSPMYLVAKRCQVDTPPEVSMLDGNLTNIEEY
jgi:hypothetical protein